MSGEMRILALDPSLAATGYSVWRSSGVLTPPASIGTGMERLAWIRDQILDLLLASSADIVAIEGYSFASRGRALISLGELGGVVRLALHEAGVPVVEIPPACRAKYATGRGNAAKDAVLVEAVKRLGYEGHDHNVADALWLRAMALDHYDQLGRIEMPKANRTALEKIDWPEVVSP